MKNHIEMTIAELRANAAEMIRVAGLLEVWGRDSAGEPVATPPAPSVDPCATEVKLPDTPAKKLPKTKPIKPVKTARNTTAASDGRTTVTGTVREIISGFKPDAVFAVKDMLPLVQKAMPSAQVFAIKKAIQQAAKEGLIENVKRGEYRKPGRTEDSLYIDPGKRITALRTAVINAVAGEKIWSREQLMTWLVVSEKLLVDSLEDGELGQVLRELKADGRIRLVQEPGPGKAAIFETV